MVQAVPGSVIEVFFRTRGIFLSFEGFAEGDGSDALDNKCLMGRGTNYLSECKIFSSHQGVFPLANEKKTKVINFC